jgi:biotin operon repressor
MSFTVFRSVADMRGISAPQKLLLLCLSDFADDLGVSFPSVEKIGEWTGLNRKTIFKAISELRESGVLAVSKRQNGSNQYKINAGLSCTENGTPKNGTPKNGTPKNGTPKNGTQGVPKTVLGVSQIWDTNLSINLSSNLSDRRRSPDANPILENHSSGKPSEAQKPAPQEEAPAPCEPSKPIKPKVFKFCFTEILPTWEKYCREARPDLDPRQVFLAFKAYYEIGNGSSKRTSERGWTQRWIYWVGNEKVREEPKQQKTNGNTRSFVTQKFDAEYYKDVDPDDYWGTKKTTTKAN